MDSGTSVLGIRKRTATTRHRSKARGAGCFTAGFLVAAHLILDLRCEDPQCGAKVLHGADYRRIAGGLRENGLAFDSELLCALKRDGTEWLEIPVTWIEKKGGKVNPLSTPGKCWPPCCASARQPVDGMNVRGFGRWPNGKSACQIFRMFKKPLLLLLAGLLCALPTVCPEPGGGSVKNPVNPPGRTVSGRRRWAAGISWSRSTTSPR